jgi:molecular chaperone GrpE
MTDETPVTADDVPATPADEHEAALAAATAKADEHYAQYVRVLAEFDNFRKRSARELDQARQFAVERFAQELLPAMDGFELAIANGAGTDVHSLIEGQSATLRLLQKAFEKAGIRELAPEAGSAFNPAEHEAMVAQPSADMAPNSVVVTIQKGYALNGRVLRAARVIVSRAPDA